MIDDPGRGLHLRRLRPRRRRAAADHRPRRRHPAGARPRLRRRRRVAHAAAAVVHLDVRRRRPVRDPGPRPPRRPGGARRRRSSGWPGMAIAYGLFSVLRRAEAPEPFSTRTCRRRDAYVQVGIPAGRYGSVLVKAEGQTHEFWRPPDRHPGRRPSATVTGRGRHRGSSSQRSTTARPHRAPASAEPRSAQDV